VGNRFRDLIDCTFSEWGISIRLEEENPVARQVLVGMTKDSRHVMKPTLSRHL
jgi:hypothetical protein